MAYVGLRKIIIAERTGAKTYGEPFAFGKAIGMNVTPNYSEGSLNADDVQAEYDKEFNYAELSMNTSTVPLEAHDTMFGHTVNENAVDFNANDEAKYVGQGWIAPEKWMERSIIRETFCIKQNIQNHQKNIQQREILLSIKHHPSVDERLRKMMVIGKQQRGLTHQKKHLHGFTRNLEKQR